MFDKKHLENEFSNDFGSTLFPILAEIYLLEDDLKRAKKVCIIGLEHNSHNTDGKFILARISIKERDYRAAEKYCQNVS